MQKYEQLGLFYLGKTYDLEAGKATDELVLYDSKDLTTHAVCVGMTGSGKTGLCLALLEEAAIDGIPVIAIDPKGDLGNLLLTFPRLAPEDFLPWVDSDEARRRNVSPEQLAATTAETWRKGLADWGQDGQRIERFRSAVDLTIYTPGSTSGMPLTVLQSFAAPGPELREDAEALGDRVAATVAGLVGLLGIDADPITSREHILLSNILDRAWRAGQDLDLAGIIRAIQTPPLEKVGLVDLETFYPAKERFELATRLNNVLASPSFAAWLEGEPLDVGRLLHTAEGKPRVSILSIAHLSESERMFFVTILLSEILAWTRGQSGTSSLRAIVYMDEVFGYFPPSANPPSKKPMLTLLKQARAFGVGIVLATQNPVDLDYKGLSNAGTWFLGRLQTERDKARVLDGLEGASAAAGASFNRREMEATLARLANRVFVMNNVHEDRPSVFQTRWALSYLRGPLTREQIRQLSASRKTAGQRAAPLASPSSGATQSGATKATATAASAQARPMIPPTVSQVYLPWRGTRSADGRMVYRPALFGRGRVHYVAAKSGIDEWVDVALVAPIAGAPQDDVWADSQTLADLPTDLETEPAAGAGFADLPAALAQAKSYAPWISQLKDHLYRTQAVTLWKSAAQKITSRPGESERDFRIRISHGTREARDAAVDKLRARYAAKAAALEERIRRAQQRVEKEKAQANQHTLSAAISLGASMLGALLGKKMASATNLGRAASAAKAAGRAVQQRADVGEANETVESLQAQLQTLEAELKTQVDEIVASSAPDQLELEPVALHPKKTDVAVEKVVLAWLPYWEQERGTSAPAF